MKSILIYLFLLSGIGLSQQGGIRWSQLEYNFGTIKQGDKVSTLFKYYNESDTTFEIENVVTSCGCTVGEWSRQPLNIGDSGVIKVTFDSKGKNKTHEKVITVYSSQGVYDLLIKVNITKT